MAYNGKDNKKKKFKQSLIVALAGFIVIAAVVFGAVLNIKKNVKTGIVNSGNYISEKIVKELEANCIVKESIAVEAAPVATTEVAITTSAMGTVAAVEATTEPAITYKEVETFTPDLKYFMPNSLSTEIGDAPKDKK